MKGISLVEQHVEKLVVGVLAVILLLILALQFLSSPNRVSMGGEEVSPGEIEGRLRNKTDLIRGRLAGEANEPPLVDGGVPKVADDFLQSLDKAVSPRARLPRIDHALAKSLLPGDVASGEAIYHLPRFPPLIMVEVRQESAAIERSFLAANPGLREFIGDSDGADITWSIPVARVDLAALRSELRAAPEGTTAIPELWYNGGLFLVDLVFERQELGESGWSSPEVVPVLPGAFSLRKELGTPDAVLRDEVFRLLSSRERALAIIQPPFLPTEREVFTPGAIMADVGARDAGESDEVSRLRRSIASKSANLARVEADLKELGGPLRGAEDKDRTRDDRAKDDGGSSGGSGGGMGFGSGAPSGRRAASGADDEATRGKRRILTGQLDRLANEVQRLSEQLQRLAPDSAVVATAMDASDLSKADSLLVWAHDLGVRPGVTYRYRVRLDVYNPFFARKRQLSTRQAELAEAFTLRTADSEWSAPATMEPDVAFFLVDSGLGEGRLGLGTAKFEVFRFERGERRRETFVVQPGERIGDVREAGTDKRDVDFGTEWFLVDVVEGLPVDGRGDSRGRSARVLVSDDRGRTMFRTATVDSRHPVRRKFNDEVEDARAATARPSESPGGAGGVTTPNTPIGGPAGN